MATNEDMQKLIIRGGVAEAGIEKEFKTFLSEFQNKYESLENDEEKAALLFAVVYFAIESQDKL